MIRLSLTAVALLLFAVSLAVADDKPGSRPRNVVLIVADDMGYQAGCYGHPVVKTPNLDRLAKDGTRFTRAYCTTASCSASRSVIMTGLYNHATGHYGHAHGDGHFSTYESILSLPVILADAGYRTCSIGKYHLAPEYVYKFEAYRNEGVQGNRNTVRMAKNARQWIAENDDRPFFLYFCPSDPHRGGSPDKFSNFNDQPDRYPGITPVRYQPEEVAVPDWLPDTPEVRRELAEFYQAISRMDQGIGELLKALEDTGHADDTLVIFCSDNGPPFPGAKTTLYDPGARLPLIVRHPDAKKRGITTDARVTWADITPSILDFCGVTPKPAPPRRRSENVGHRITEGKKQPYKFHGRSFLTALEQEHAKDFDEIYASHTFHEITMYYPMRAVVSGKYKYILNLAHQLPYPFASDLYASPTWQGVLERDLETYGQRSVEAYVHRPRHELYDLEADPGETKNLATSPAYEDVLKRLQQKLQAWQKATDDPWITKWVYE